VAGQTRESQVHGDHTQMGGRQSTYCVRLDTERSEWMEHTSTQSLFPEARVKYSAS